MKRKIGVMVLLSGLFLLVSCSPGKETSSSITENVSYKANIEVFSVGEYVQYIDLAPIYYEKGQPIYYMSFKNTDYVAGSPIASNDYYIISGDSQISPLELHVGDRLYWENSFAAESEPPYYYGGYLYLVE